MKKIRLLDLCCGAGSCAMGYKLAVDDIDWMNDREIAQAIPPAYSQFMGEQFLRSRDLSI